MLNWREINFRNIWDECTPYVKADIVIVLETPIKEGHKTLTKEKNFVKNFVSKLREGH